MSLPPELRILCYQLSSTPSVELPRLIPTLLRHVSRCEGPLSHPTSNTGKVDGSASVVLVHRLKTQLTTLLNGKSSEGRFTAAALIKRVVEVGGWEVLRGAEAWTRGLLALLGKPDPAPSKELCIIALTKIYCMTHQYPTLVREITTPTLPAFIASCLNLISSPLSRASSAISSLTETVFGCLNTLLPRHTTIIRPFEAQIRLIANPYLAPTLSDKLFVSTSLRESSRGLIIALHQIVAKNSGGEEWNKAVRKIVMDIHRTSDHVFRAVIEDWESTSGYIAKPIDVNGQLCGGGISDTDLSRWDGVAAGVERLTGLLEILEQYFKSETSMPVSIPLGSVLDMVTRMLSISVPLESTSTRGGARLHPAIDRDEQYGLYCGLPQIHVATLQLVRVLADRMQENFSSIAPGLFDQIMWAFASGRITPEFRLATYNVVSRILLQVGQSFGRTQTAKLAPIIRSCCKDLPLDGAGSSPVGAMDNRKMTQHSNGINANQNADTFLQNKQVAHISGPKDVGLELAASSLLPLLLSHVPQHHLDISLRSLIERTAILIHDKNGMLASILNPFVGKNGKAMASILPHIAREFSNDNVVEILLRPRMPLLPTPVGGMPNHDALAYESEENDVMFVDAQAKPTQPKQILDINPMAQGHALPQLGLDPVVDHVAGNAVVSNPFASDLAASVRIKSPFDITPMTSTSRAIPLTVQKEDVKMDLEDEDSDDSVHLNMELDSDSSEGELG
ncbi:rRNA processing/ribosome biogenesis-domain-containing protein [Tricladium varicosporioides]|nr:rRNA processing/ribosome biogenesis-domain-containing protein [Hymenoscyphus varicosporioides]